MNTLTTTEPDHDQLLAHLDSELSTLGYDTESDLSSVPICSIAAGILVEHLQSLGIGQDGANERVFDPNWQQFLPRTDVSPPRALAGSRSEVRQSALKYGVPEELLSLWDIETSKDLASQRSADHAAMNAAQEAEENGLWESFMAS